MLYLYLAGGVSILSFAQPNPCILTWYITFLTVVGPGLVQLWFNRALTCSNKLNFLSAQFDPLALPLAEVRGC